MVIYANINYEHEHDHIPEIETLPKNEFEQAIIDVCKELAETLIKKNRDYGDSYRKLKEKYGDTYLVIRQTEKLNRLETLIENKNNIRESVSDTKLDSAGYYILDLACERVKA